MTKKLLSFSAMVKQPAIFQFESTGMKRYLRDLEAKQAGGSDSHECSLPSGTDGIYSKVYRQEAWNGKD